MTRKVLYMAHAVRPTAEEIEAIPQYRLERGTGEYQPDAKIFRSREDRVRLAVRLNIDRAMDWLRWLRASFPETTFIAPWITSILSGEDDANPAQREAGLVDDCAVIERCDGIVLCGPRISEGMRREMAHGAMRYGDYLPDDGFEVYDLTGYGNGPPGVLVRGDDGAYQEFTANATHRTHEDAERLWRLGNGR